MHLKGMVLLFLLPAVALVGCRNSEPVRYVSLQHLVDVLEAETTKSPDRQDQELIRKLIAELRREVKDSDRTRTEQLRLIEQLRREQTGTSPSRESTSGSPLVVAVTFSFDTRPRDLDGDDVADVIDVTVWPLDAAGDTVKVVRPMLFVLSRQAPIPGLGGAELQRWSESARDVDQGWQRATVFGGHHFRLVLNEKARQARRVVLRVSYVSADGKEHTAERPMKL